MPLSVIAAQVALEIGTKLLPHLSSRLSDWVKSRGSQKLSVESRLQSAEAMIEELGQGIIKLEEALRATQAALESSENERQALAKKVQRLSLWSGLALAVSIGVAVLVFLQRGAG